MKNFQATTIGPEIPRGYFLIKIHSVFRRAINLQLFDSYAPSGQKIRQNQGNECNQPKKRYYGELYSHALVTILSLSLKLNGYPQSICLDSIEDFMAFSLKPGNTGFLCTDGVTLYSTNPNATFRFSFTSATRLNRRTLPRIQHIGTTWQSSADMLASIQIEHDTDLNIGNIMNGCTKRGVLGEILTKAAVDLGKSVQVENTSALRSATLRLLGFGSGLTPSGDDFLCGFITAAHCQFNRYSNCLFQLKEIVLANLTKTNSISASFLQSATHECVLDSLCNFAEAISNGFKLEESLKQLCTLGHSSGMDIATGFLYGLKIWRSEQ